MQKDKSQKEKNLKDQVDFITKELSKNKINQIIKTILLYQKI